METIKLELPQGKKMYFASDQHFAISADKRELERERHFIRWLDYIRPDCGVLVLCGDLFDFWFEYAKVVPKGAVRVLGRLAEFTDSGIPVYFFPGNHDLWVRDYFEKELSMRVLTERCVMEVNGKKILIGHGDGLGPDDKGFKRMKKVFQNPVAQWLYRYLLHPDWALSIAQYFSRKGRASGKKRDNSYRGDDREWLVLYSKRKYEGGYDFFIFGHRHLPIDVKIAANSRYINLGDWLDYFSYAQFDGDQVELKYWPLPNLSADSK